jgi:Holliday junction resolvasome RuvABC endonuclease subunit
MKGSFGGLDPSYSCTACVVIDPDGRSHRRLVSTSKKAFTSHPERLAFIRDEVLRFFDGAQPAVICVEGYAHGSTYWREGAGEIGGVLRVALWECVC